MPRRAPGQLRRESRSGLPRESTTEEFMALLREHPEAMSLAIGDEDFDDDDCPICQSMRAERGEGHGRVLS